MKARITTRRNKTSGATLLIASLWVTASSCALATALNGQERPTFSIEVESGPFWQSRNDVQIPNNAAGTRFSLKELVGSGAWPAVRLYATWNINERHGMRALAAPLSITESGVLEAPVTFAGSTFATGAEVEGTYRFNSWRLGYRYLAATRPTLDFWVGVTAKLRDAEIRLDQGTVTSRDTDLGFVPLLHLATDWRPTERTHVLFDFDGLAGGPGRAFDANLEFGYDLASSWMISAGYRTLEGGADVDSVYNFAWLHYGVVSLVYQW